MTVDEQVGRNVHDLMWRARLKQSALYSALGISRFTLSKKLRGDIAWSARDVQVAAQVLGVDPGVLFEVGWAPRGSNPQPTDWGLFGRWRRAGGAGA